MYQSPIFRQQQLAEQKAREDRFLARLDQLTKRLTDK
jgi:hypothetical protein